MANIKKEPNPIDIHVGAMVRLKRNMLGMSQEKLGESLGVTFQQVQKYEKGTNRISASKMQEIAKILKTPVSFFFETGSDAAVEQSGFADGESSNYVVDFLSSSEGMQLSIAFSKIKDPKVRKKIIDLVRSLADEAE